MHNFIATRHVLLNSYAVWFGFINKVYIIIHQNELCLLPQGVEVGLEENPVTQVIMSNL